MTTVASQDSSGTVRLLGVVVEIPGDSAPGLLASSCR